MKTSLSLVAAIAAALPAYAQETQLDTVIVSANRIEQPITETLAPVSVITREEIEKKKITSIKQILATLPGVSLSSSGGKAQLTSLRTRGTNSTHTLILLNGQRISSATLGSTTFNLIPVDQIDRIEYVRGPRSALYGSDAIGGILQIFTNQKPAETRAKVSATVGSDNTQVLNGSLRGQAGDRTSYSLHLSTERSDGYDVRQDAKTDDDGYSARTLSASINHQINDALSLTANSNIWHGNYEFDPSFGGDETDYENYAHGVALTYQQSILKSTLSLAFSEDDALTYGNGVAKSSGSRFVTQHKEASWLNNIAAGDATDLTAGIDFKRDDVSKSVQQYDVEERDTTSVFAGAIHSIDALDLEASVRRTKDDQFGFHNTWSLAGAWNFNNGVQLSLSRGTGFKAPTFNDLYWPGSGNPYLQPERSRSTELTLSGGESVNWSVSAYETDIKNLIAWAPDINNVWKPSNVNQANIKGLEAAISFTKGPLTHSLSAEVMDAKNTKADKKLTYRPSHQYKWQLDYAAHEQWNLGANWLYEGSRFTDTGNTNTLPSYSVVNLYASFTPLPQLELGLRIENAFDRQYQSNKDFNTPDRQLLLTVGYSF